ncbi:MAG: winged helix-turn-helix transcriptional regulator [Candidatus Bathyarchaeia archaeon]|jgi:DNA-binding Lrp family transcriptional regulator
MKRDKQRHRQGTVRDSNAEREPLKDTEAALISELISNSRRSDRELAKAIGVSQPTVSRIIKRLEKEGVVNEYTMIPDFRKLGYNLCAFIFLKLKDLPPERVESVRQAVKESLSQSHFVILLLERGLGLSRDAVMICLYKNYASYAEHRNIIREFPYITPSDVDSFLIDLNDEVHYRYLTFAGVAKDLLRSIAKNE